MPSRPCIRCSALVPLGSVCARCGPSRSTPGRGSGWDASRFREAVLVAAGHRCQFVNGDGARCTATIGVQAHHVVGLRDGGANAPAGNGIAYCRRHHNMMEYL